MVLTAYFVLSPVTGLFCHRRRADTSAQLDTSVGVTGPHDFAVRIGVARQRHLRVHRIPPRVRDDRDTPLSGARRLELVAVICPTGQAKYFLREDWTGFRWHQLICPSGKSVCTDFRRTTNSRYLFNRASRSFISLSSSSFC